MAHARTPASFLAIGDQSLLIQCCARLLDAGHTLAGVVSSEPRVRQWCAERQVRCLDRVEAVLDDPALSGFDYLLSITNLRMLPEALLARARRLAINFHDGPLPRYAGLNAPIWAMLHGESSHGITWHVMTGEADTGDILVTRPVAIDPDDTGFTLNARCYEAGLDGFDELLEQLGSNTLRPQPQDLSERTYFGRADRPAGAATLEWRRPAEELQRLVRALDFGPYASPLVLPRLRLADTTLLVREARVAEVESAAAPGTVVALGDGRVTIRCGTGALDIMQVTDLRGGAVDLVATLRAHGIAPGTVLPSFTRDELAALDDVVAALARTEGRWRTRLRRFEATALPVAGQRGGASTWRTLPMGAAAPSDWIAAAAVSLARVAQSADASFAYVPAGAVARPDWLAPYASSVLPMRIDVPSTERLDAVRSRVDAAVADAEAAPGYLRDLPARDPEVRAAVPCEDAPVRIIRIEAAEAEARRLAGGAALALAVPGHGRGDIGVVADTSRIEPETLDALLDSLAAVAAQFADATATVGDVALVTPAQRAVLAQLGRADDEDRLPPAEPLCTHQAFERQAARTPDHVAATCRGRRMTYAELNAAANRLARHLQQQGVVPGDRVGVMVERSLEMLVALYAVQKCGAAYVPLDPQYPADRLAYMIGDAAMRCVIVRARRDDVAAAVTQVALADVAPALQALPDGNLDLDVPPSALAYMIYTSGSTGRPKGVMVEHRNVLNFFAGMDHRIDATPGVWLAVTSISFDISVLELFWTLARGFTVVLHAEASHGADLAPAGTTPPRPLPFGLFYWNVASEDQDHAPDKYRLLLESAKFADTHGFNSVWTPERHFESFGGLFPNPSVTSAALATITSRVSIRAGSCVVPLHSPIRIAEEWAVVDNLSNGRVALSVASGWATPDFAIRPESFARAKQVMFESTDTVRKLWRGESVTFDGPKGPVQVRTLPRPIQPELPIWVTTAGNVQTFIEAGKLGANVLTHLLGQSIEDVAQKVRAYRDARREAGHAGDGVVTLMLHTFIGPDERTVEDTVRQPFKDYLKSATFLVKAAAWQFPTFKRLSEAQEQTLDEFFANISAEDMDGLLEFAYQRYYRTSGLFGTVDRALEMVDQVRGAGIDEIACLIDFGIEADTVLRHLPFLDELRRASETRQAPVDEHAYSLAGLLADGAVTHFQCTPSMARVVLAEPRARTGLTRLRQMMVGGEGLPPDVATDLAGLLPGRVTNMYGPTETTIWSTVGDVTAPGEASSVPIGRPLAHQQIYVLDDAGAALPPGVIGEIVIGGDGVTRGYWEQPALTASRFVPDPFDGRPGARMYRTGDRGRFRADGRIECLGRVDHQVKIRGHRVEPGEIETVLRATDGVADAVVILREDVPGDQRLVAYLRGDGAHPADDALRASLRSRLPEVMVPSAFVWLTALPLTPNGKVDRRALPVPKAAAAAPAGATAPTNALEGMVAEIWQRALNIPSCGTRDNFFDLGGHSLLIVQVLSELRQKVSTPIQMTDLFKYTTIESLARFLGGGSETPAAVSQASARAARRRMAMDRRGR